ncbi:MAG: tripartite tricarboxylate transporter substrate binding protein, partial [Betaproteobacteria bacterium]|nr:tripartite tricarboxylate transporter substrate binding protein [Betaproteobacteria bacterium]
MRYRSPKSVKHKVHLPCEQISHRRPSASVGNGTAHHLIVEMWKTATASQAQHVPYRGAGPAMADLLAGQVDFMFDGLGTSVPH